MAAHSLRLRWLLLTLLFLSAAGTSAAQRTYELVGVNFQYRETVRYDTSARPGAVVLRNAYARAELANADDWSAEARAGKTVYEIDLVYSRYPVDTSHWITRFQELMPNRVRNILALDPSLNRPDIRWTLVAQTSCSTATLAKGIFHGFVIKYRSEGETFSEKKAKPNPSDKSGKSISGKGSDKASDGSGKISDKSSDGFGKSGDGSGKTSDKSGDGSGKTSDKSGDGSGKSADKSGDGSGKSADKSGDGSGKSADKSGDGSGKSNDNNDNSGKSLDKSSGENIGDAGENNAEKGELDKLKPALLPKAKPDTAAMPLTEEERQKLTYRRHVQENMNVVKNIIGGVEPVDDSTVFIAFNNHPEWKDMLVVMDWTGSMYIYGAQVLAWNQTHLSKGVLKYLAVFNDGDDILRKGDVSFGPNRKPEGKTGGIYFCEPKDLDQVIITMELAMLNGDGGDFPENDAEALLAAIKEYPGAKEVVLIADADFKSEIRDLKLIRQIKVPIRVVACRSVKDKIVNPDLVTLAWRTGGSLIIGKFEHKFPMPAMKLNRNILKINKVKYRFNEQRQYFELVSKKKYFKEK